MRLHTKRDITLLVVLTHCRVTVNLINIRSFFSRDLNGIRPPDFPEVESIHSLFLSSETFAVGARQAPNALIVYGLVIHNIDVNTIISQWQAATMPDVFYASFYTGKNTVIMTL